MGNALIILSAISLGLLAYVDKLYSESKLEPDAEKKVSIVCIIMIIIVLIGIAYASYGISENYYQDYQQKRFNELTDYLHFLNQTWNNRIISTSGI
jgi:hypothetical protein